jgi:V8-like Glu-specific endopeptidase
MFTLAGSCTVHVCVRAIACTVISLVFWDGAVAASEPCTADQNKNYVTNVGWIQEDFVQVPQIDGTPIILNPHPNPASLRHFRLRVSATNPMPKDWRLTFYDVGIQQPLQTMSPKDFADRTSFWSRRFEGGEGQAILDTRDAAALPFLKITGAIMVAKDARVPYYSVQDRAALKWQCLSCPRLDAHKNICDAEPIKCTKSSIKERRRGQSVGMMMMFGANAAWTCSGFLVSSSLFLTNWHCGGARVDQAQSFWDNDSLRNLVVDFSWDGDELSNEYGWSGEPMQPGQNVITNRDKDYAIFRIKPLQQSIGLPPVVKIKQGNSVTDGMPIHIIHHPLGRVKYLTEQNCSIDTASYPSWFDKTSGVDFLHQCDTEGGSSGAPVFNQDGYVLGVHHSGYTQDSSGQCDGKNKAVKIDNILNDLPAEVRTEILASQP